MRLVWAGTFDPDFSRNKKLARLLAIAGIEAEVVRETVWSADRIALAERPSLRVALRALVRYPLLLVRLLRRPAPDLYLVSYPGWFDMPVVRLAAALKRAPVVFDPFFSLHDTVVSDRGLYSGRSLVARFAAFFDRWSLRLADTVIADTEPQLELYRELAGGLKRAGGVLAVGADDDLFFPRPEPDEQPKVVLYYGKLIPLHGVVTIVEAAASLQSSGLHTVMIGEGPDRDVLDEAIARTGAVIERHGMIPLEELPAHVARAAVCLGVFGASEKAGRVIPHKVYEALAMRRPVVTRDGPAVRAAFIDGEVVAIPPEDPHALADAIRALMAQPNRREQIADAGHRAYVSRFEQRRLSAELVEILQATVRERDLPLS